MRALLSTAIGGPETLQLQEIADPVPGLGDVLIAVKAVGVNYPDSLIIEDKYQFRPERPFAPGGEVAGTVIGLGDGTEGLSIGDRVIGFAGWGGMAEKLTLNAQRCVKIPDSMPFDEAAAFLMTYGTSHYALIDRGGMKAGDQVLVLGAAGGVGVAAVELAKAVGARVIAAVSSEEKAAFARDKGADATIVYPTGALDKDQARAFSDAVKAATGGAGADIIYDGVGGDYAEPALRAIAWQGRYLVVGFPAGIPKIPLNLTLLKGCQIVGVFWGAFTAREPAQHNAYVADLLALYAAGKIKPTISARYALEQGGEAIAHLRDRKALGKVVIELE